MKRLFAILCLAVLFVTGCGNEDDCPVDRISMAQYIENNNLEVENTTQGFQYQILRPGSNRRPVSTDRVTVNYRGYFTDETEFDANDSISFNLQGVIRGWTLGIPIIGEGGSIRLFIPPALGYGARQVGDICPNSELIYDVDLLSF